MWKPKSRLAAQWHQDPDLEKKAEAGRLSSPTVQQQTIQVGLQTAASRDMDIEIADIKVAFLNSHPYGPDNTPVYCWPPTGMKGIPLGALLRVKKPFYGVSDDPEEWRKRLDGELQKLGMVPLRMDACASKYMETIGGVKVVSGIILVLVDDMLILTMKGAKEFKKQITQLKGIFTFGS